MFERKFLSVTMSLFYVIYQFHIYAMKDVKGNDNGPKRGMKSEREKGIYV
jgi:hypothetical protein